MALCSRCTFLFIVLLINVSYILCYKPVIYMHGVLAGPKEGKPMKIQIEKAHPGTNVTIIDAFNDEESLHSISKQLTKIIPLMQSAMNKSKEGCHLVCFSQGGIICRAVLELLPTHNVENFISLSSPQGGQYGLTDYLNKSLPLVVKKDLYKILYTDIGQTSFSIANYWNDPHHQDLFTEPSLDVFLAKFNNQTVNPDSKSYKANFLRIKNLITIGGPDDGVITPWQSSHFGMFDKNESVVDVRKQEWYLKDSFGLQTLDKKNAFHIYSIPRVQHVHWYRNQTVFDCCIAKWLT